MQQQLKAQSFSFTNVDRSPHLEALQHKRRKSSQKRDAVHNTHHSLFGACKCPSFSYRWSNTASLLHKLYAHRMEEWQCKDQLLQQCKNPEHTTAARTDHFTEPKQQSCQWCWSSSSHFAGQRNIFAHGQIQARERKQGLSIYLRRLQRQLAGTDNQHDPIVLLPFRLLHLLHQLCPSPRSCGSMLDCDNVQYEHLRPELSPM